MIYYVIPTAGNIADTFAYEYLQTVPADRVIAVEHNSKTVPCAYNYAECNNNNKLARLACNYGARYLLFINDDMDFTNSDGLLEATLHALRESTNLGTVGCVLYYPDGSMQHRGQIWGRDAVGIIQIGHNGVDLNIPEDVDTGQVILERVQGNTGAFLAIRSELFNEVGGFPQGYEVCFEDIELNVRVGHPNLCIISHSAVHLESQTRTKHIPESDYLKIRQCLEPHIGAW